MTFLPFPSFSDSAEVLDKQRCWKQVVEAAQILNTLDGRSNAWKNHPAVKMWEGHEKSLIMYFNEFLEVVKVKHQVRTNYTILDPFNGRGLGSPVHPWWLGNPDFHRAMRARLIEKKPEFYLPLFPNDKGFNHGKYLWPDMINRKFYLI